MLVKVTAFDCEIKHRTGKQHGNADGMSRRPLDVPSARFTTSAYDTKRGKRVDVVTVESSSQTEILSEKTEVKAQT